jgi:hypothetical protein
MFNIKIYDRKNNFLITLSEKEISSNFWFSATVNSWFSSFKFDYYWDFKFEHRQIVKLLRKWDIIYQWFIIWIVKTAVRSWKKCSIEVSWMIWLLAFKPWSDWSYSNDPWVLIRTVFTSVSWLFITDKIQNYWSSISFSSSWNTALWFLQDILKNTSDFWLFVNENNEVLFWPYENEHFLTYWNEVYWIEIKEDSSDYYNRFRINYSWGNLINENAKEVEKYWESYLVVNDTSIKNLATAQIRMNSLFIEHAIKNMIKVSVNNKADYYAIKPWDVLTIRNTEWNMEKKAVKQIRYEKDWAVISLDTYNSLEKVI